MRLEITQNSGQLNKGVWNGQKHDESNGRTHILTVIAEIEVEGIKKRRGEVIHGAHCEQHCKMMVLRIAHMV